MKRKAHQSLLALVLFAAVVGCAVQARSQGAAPAVASRNPAIASAAPAVHTVPGRLSRVVVVRLKYNTDVLDGLKTAVANEKIKNAVILSGAGSLIGYRVHVVSNVTFPPTEAFMKQAGPYDLLTTTGYVINGRVHAHITVSDTQKAIGGHLEPGTKVFTFVIITLGVLDEGTSLDRFDDANWR